MANLANLMEGGEFFTHPCSHPCTASPTEAPHVHPDGVFVIIKDPTKTAFSPKAQVYMSAHTWSCSSSPLDKCIMASILIHSPEVLGTSSSSHHCLSQNITVGVTEHIHRLFIVASFTFGEPLPVRMTHIENTHAEARETLMQRALVRVQKDSHFGRQFDSFSQA